MDRRDSLGPQVLGIVVKQFPRVCQRRKSEQFRVNRKSRGEFFPFCNLVYQAVFSSPHCVSVVFAGLDGRIQTNWPVFICSVPPRQWKKSVREEDVVRVRLASGTIKKNKNKCEILCETNCQSSVNCNHEEHTVLVHITFAKPLIFVCFWFCRICLTHLLSRQSNCSLDVDGSSLELASWTDADFWLETKHKLKLKHSSMRGSFTSDKQIEMGALGRNL